MAHHILLRKTYTYCPISVGSHCQMYRLTLSLVWLVMHSILLLLFSKLIFIFSVLTNDFFVRQFKFLMRPGRTAK